MDELHYIPIVLSAVLGGIIGYERQRRNQPAGFRTHIVICVGACLVMLVGLSRAEGPDGPRPFADPARMGAQVVTGMGFLGAGAILRFGPTVKGLTTAAGIWTVAGIGLAVGAGLYGPAVLVTALLITVLSLFASLEHRLFAGKDLRRLSVTALHGSGLIKEIVSRLDDQGIEVVDLGLSRNVVEKRIEINATLRMPSGTLVTEVTRQLQDVPGVQEMEIS